MSMDTEAIWQAVCAYGASKAAREPFESDENMAEIKRLLKEAEDERAELLKENERLHDLAGGWRPIETAPKDGSGILAYTGDGGIIEAYWSYGDWEQGVCEASYDMAQAYIRCKPTHWMPLPPPPEAA